MMAGIKGKNTKPERLVRSLLHGAGFRFRLHRRDLPGRPDLVLPKYRKAVFVNGCFWHGHENCDLFRIPHTRQDFWSAKIESNRKRDARNIEDLLQQGWGAIVIWECALTKARRLSPEELLDQLEAAINSPAPCITSISS